MSIGEKLREEWLGTHPLEDRPCALCDDTRRVVTACSGCGKGWTDHARYRLDLPFIGWQELDPEDECLGELRNCGCGSTLMAVVDADSKELADDQDCPGCCDVF